MYKTNYMRNVPNFTEGLSRVLDLGSIVNKRKFRIINNSHKFDQEVLSSDWNAVGDDIRRAIDEFRRVGHNRR
jgi:hypothetical protein